MRKAQLLGAASEHLHLESGSWPSWFLARDFRTVRGDVVPPPTPIETKRSFGGLRAIPFVVRSRGLAALWSFGTVPTRLLGIG